MVNLKANQPTQAIIDKLHRVIEGKSIWLAYSGGVDSHVLLHLLATAEPAFSTMHVVHVNHGLQQQSQQWAVHCENTCQQFGLPFHLINAEVKDIDDLGLEAAARQARYQAFQSLVPSDAVLLTAQHQHDQAETLLLQLLRGAGPKGLAAMAYQSQMNDLTVIRPLLATSQLDIEAYADLHKLNWVDDPSNQNTDFNRNYIRHQLWPLIEQRWPSAAKTLSRSSRLCAEADSLISEIAQQDLKTVQDKDALNIELLLQLSLVRQRNCLRYFMQQQQFSLPSETVLQQIIESVCHAADDALPQVKWQNYEAKRYQNYLYLQPQQVEQKYLSNYTVNSHQDLMLNDTDCLTWVKSKKGIKASLIEAGLTVKFRQGGEKIQLAGKQHHQSLKNLFQEWHVPPWQRARTPLLFDGEELIAVVGQAIAQQAIASTDEAGFKPVLKQR